MIEFLCFIPNITAINMIAFTIFAFKCKIHAIHMIQFLIFFFFLYLLHNNVRNVAESLSDYLIKFFVGLVACIIPTGFLLSAFNWINQPLAWGIGALFFAQLISIVLVYFGEDFNLKNFNEQYQKNFPKAAKGLSISKIFYFFVLKRLVGREKFSLRKALQELRIKSKVFWDSLPAISKVIFGLLAFALAFVSIINLIVVYVAVPNEWDSMTGHLVKCAYYIQNGNMNRVGGTMWSVDYYPNSLPTLQIFGYYLFHSENGFKFIHYFSYWIFALASYGTAKKISSDTIVGKLSTSSLLVFFVTALLPTALVQATTTETDIVLTAYLSCLVYFLFAYKNNPSPINLVLVGLITCILLGHKITFLLILPAVAVVGIYTVVLRPDFKKKIPLLALVLGIGIVLYVLPTGYIGNIKESGKFSIGSISGPREVMNWFRPESYTSKDILKYGTLNVGRYASDFLNLDGIRSTPIGKEVNDALRYLPNKVFEKLPLEQDKYWAVSPFYVKNPPIEFYQERPYWGIISFGLVLPIILILGMGFRKNWKNHQNRSLLILSIAAIIHFCSLCYTAAYDPIKGRYFMNMAVWCMPLVLLSGKWQMISSKKKFSTYYMLLMSFVISISAILVVFNKRIHPILAQKNIFTMNRMEQMTLVRPAIYEAYKKYDELVPKNATVALGTTMEDFEYPLWGENFTRKLIPIHPFHAAVKPIPAEAQYLFYTKGVLPFQEGDIQLNQEDKKHDTPVDENVYFIRKLK